jgi:putative ABC transport system ATP-binding protein
MLATSAPLAGVPETGARPAHCAIRATNIVKTYGELDTAVTALRGVSIDIPAARFTAIMGPSGSGKSTLMHCLAGLDAVTSGRVMLGDVDLTALDDDGRTRLRRDSVGFVFQSLNLLPAFTALQNILLPLELAGKRPEREWLDFLVGTLGIGDRLHHRPSGLSGGQQQRVAIARALVPRPDVVFADEPTGNLDSRNGRQVLGLLQRAVREFGQTVVMVTHDPRVAAYADTVVMLADGQVVRTMHQPTLDTIAAALTDFGGA